MSRQVRIDWVMLRYVKLCWQCWVSMLHNYFMPLVHWYFRLQHWLNLLLLSSLDCSNAVFKLVVFLQEFQHDTGNICLWAKFEKCTGSKEYNMLLGNKTWHYNLISVLVCHDVLLNLDKHQHFRVIRILPCLRFFKLGSLSSTMQKVITACNKLLKYLQLKICNTLWKSVIWCKIDWLIIIHWWNQILLPDSRPPILRLRTRSRDLCPVQTRSKLLDTDGDIFENLDLTWIKWHVGCVNVSM